MDMDKTCANTSAVVVSNMEQTRFSITADCESITEPNDYGSVGQSDVVPFAVISKFINDEIKLVPVAARSELLISDSEESHKCETQRELEKIAGTSLETGIHPVINDTEYISDPDGYDSDRDPEYEVSPRSNTPSTSESEARHESELEEPEHNGISLDIPKGRAKKGRKRKYLNMTRAENKRAKNSNELHFDYKRKAIEKKTFDETFKCKCYKKCHIKVSTDERKREFIKYWELGSYDAQTALLGALVSEEPKNRKYEQNIRSRQFSTHYKLNKTAMCAARLV
ncbi:unnamed protein product [Psylliodes chrysocephalus]|uniref:Uncharacterized protein n=1 Tax=Psylliodes chrysocephalus TaxID=3402493 RepID=A0A9P0CA01_9CUCU|nr:unnamed protein product [Psylliodes chrysocephala]